MQKNTLQKFKFKLMASIDVLLDVWMDGTQVLLQKQLSVPTAEKVLASSLNWQQKWGNYIIILLKNNLVYSV